MWVIFSYAVRQRNILMYRPVFLVNVESEGPYEPQRLPLEAIRVMRGKITALKAAAEALRGQGDTDGGIQGADT
jgi:DNA-directed RNA polymerase I and III subunit RPAC1